MTRKAKGILIAVLGVGLLGGFLVVFAAMVVSVGLLAAASEAENDRTTVTGSRDEQRRKPAASPKNSSGSVAPELVGRWLKREGAGETDFTGKSRYRSHRLYLYEIAADGAVDYTFDRETLTIMQCEIKERKKASGTAASEGATLSIALDEVTLAESNSCDGGETVRKTLPAETRYLKWNLKTEGERTELCLAESSGEVCYLKQ
jgi:hypothetical protein